MTPKRYNTIGEYLKDVPLTHRAGLKKLYAQIKKHYPNATEHISYNKPLFKLHGHPLVGFQATKHHSSLFVWSGTALKTLGKMLEKYDTSMSTIRFAPNASLPDRIVKAVLKTREKESPNDGERKRRNRMNSFEQTTQFNGPVEKQKRLTKCANSLTAFILIIANDADRAL